MQKISTLIIILLWTLGTHALSAQDYCIPEGDCSFGDAIYEFSMNGFTNISECGSDNGVAGYSDFTALTGLVLGQGTSYPLFLRTGFGEQKVSIWIDADNSASFESSELLLADLDVGIDLVETSITVPIIPDGSYRLRVQTSWENPSSSDPCSLGGGYESYGETEDYTVSIETLSCLPIGALMVNNITNNSAVVQWSEQGTATTWDLEIVKAGETATGNPSAGYNNIQNPITIDNLEPATSYNVYVRAECEMGDVSTWTVSSSFSTLCASFPTPFVEDFSGLTPNGTPLPLCWSKARGELATGPTSINNDLPEGWIVPPGSQNVIGVVEEGFLEIESRDWLISPIIDIDNPQIQQVEFNISIFANIANSIPTTLTTDDEIHFLISDDQGTTWSVIQTWTAEDVVEPQTRMIYSLATYGGLDAVFAFYHTNGTEHSPMRYQVLIDNFTVRSIPTCPEILDAAVSNIGANVATLTWSAAATVTNWDVEIVEQGTPPTGVPTATYNDVNSTTLELFNLSPNTVYEVYVRADCGMDDTSDISAWSEKIVFETQCPSIVPNYLEDFSSFTSIETFPSCWQGAEGTLSTGPVSFGNQTWEPTGFAGAEDNTGIGTLLLGFDEDLINRWLISPIFSLMGATFQLEFDLAIYDILDGNTNLDSDDELYVLISDDNAETWTVLQFFDSSWIGSPTGEHITMDLSDYTGMDVQIAFYITNGTGSDKEIEVMLDNIAINWFGDTPMVVDVDVMDTSCFGSDDGSADATVTGGVPPYTYEWDSNLSSNLATGNYTLTVTDSEGLVFVKNFTVHQPSALAPSTLGNNESAAGVGDGDIDLTVTGGTAPYSYMWDNGATSEDITNLEAGTYCVTITDANGCTESICETIIVGSTSSTDLTALTQFDVYPNPVWGTEVQIALEFSAYRNITVQVVNTLGQIIQSYELNHVRESNRTLSAENLSSGLYFINVIDLEHQQTSTKKLVVQ